MSESIDKLTKKLQLLARPRIHVQASEGAIRIELLSAPGSTAVLAAYEFQPRSTDTDLLGTPVLRAMSTFLETAALRLEQKPKEQLPIAFAQQVYNEGYWDNPAGGSRHLKCKIKAVESDPQAWDLHTTA